MPPSSRVADVMGPACDRCGKGRVPAAHAATNPNNTDMTEYIYIGIAVILFGGYFVRKKFSLHLIVWEHELVLVYHKGKLRGLLPAGEHRLWGRGFTVTRLDDRWQEGVIQGQEFLTADKVPVKVSGLVRFRIGDAEQYVK